ncbi:MAG: UbiA-like polyprenyltransferase [Bacteroidota bacterium]
MNKYLSLIKFSHTIFALPFALIGFFLGQQQADGGGQWHLLALVLLCMVFARSAAMAFNRLLDRDIDKLNPRTAQREIPAGLISSRSALVFVIINCLLFILTTWFINPLCFYLSPIALLIILGYSYTKRFTALCHFVLGLGLSLSPIGAYLAVTGTFDVIPLLYAGVVLLWVSGFDIIYALQDDGFDESMQLHSVPVALGRRNALRLSNILHVGCALLIFFASYSIDQQYVAMGYFHWIGTFLFIALLFYQHWLVRPDDLSRVNLAFFTTNGVASLLLGTFIILDIFL